MNPKAQSRPAPLAFAGANRPWLRAAVLAVGLLMLSRDLTGPFTGLHEFNSAMYSIFARNHLRYGLSYTKLFCTWGEGPTPPAEPHHYLNHPPLIAIWTAGAFGLLGEHEWVARLIPIAATLGSAALLMAIASRLASPAVGVLAGLFYLILPIISYFGRMLDHVPLVEFLSLLMLHGYLQWSGRYGPGRSRRAGAVLYALGAVLGIGTGWGTAIMAALIVGLHTATWLRQRQLTPRVWTLISISATAFAAVLLHILWGFEWDGRALLSLFWSRVAVESLHAAGDQPGWLNTQWTFLLGNYSWAGVIAAAIWIAVVAFAALSPRFSTPQRWGQPVRIVEASLGPPLARAVFALIGVHGLLYVLAFPGPAAGHEYWQFLAAPFVAIALASFVALSHALVVSRTPQAATAVALLLVAAPMPGFMFGRDRYYREVRMPARFIEPFVRLADLVPPGSPAMTSRCWPVTTETFGRHVYRWGVAQILYYADRPLVYSRNLDEIAANSAGCSAYVLEWLDEPETESLARALSARYRGIRVRDDHLIFMLEPESRAQTAH